jgi:alpha-galactosidase
VRRIVTILLLALSLVTYVVMPAKLCAQKNAYPPVARPPMGWNSWDSYGTTVNESQVKANADWMAEHLTAYGWKYVTVDMEWFVKNPKPEGNARDSQYEMDSNGAINHRSTAFLRHGQAPDSSL